MNTHRRGFLGLLTSLPVIGDKIAEAAIESTSIPCASTLRAVVSGSGAYHLSGNGTEGGLKPVFSSRHMYALMSVLRPNTKKFEHNVLVDIDLAHNRSMSLAAISMLQRQRDKQREKQMVLLEFSHVFGFDFDVDNPRETLLRIKREFFFHSNTRTSLDNASMDTSNDPDLF